MTANSTSRRQLKIIVWSIVALAAAATTYGFWYNLERGMTWQVLLVAAVGVITALRSYKRAQASSRR